VSVCTVTQFVTANKEMNNTLTCPIYIRHICFLRITTESTSKNLLSQKVEGVIYPKASGHLLTFIPLTWEIWRVPNNASRWQMVFNSAFKGLKDAEPEKKKLLSF